MNRSELERRLAAEGDRGDRDALQRTMDLLLSRSVEEGRHSDARRLSTFMRARKSGSPRVAPATLALPESVRGLLQERPARRRLDDLILTESVALDVREFLTEQHETALLRANSLEPRHVLLLAGPPGNGKTSLAEAIAAELGLPFLTVRYDGIIDSFLGETAARIRRIVEYASAAPCVLFFDEFDAIGKERGDVHETGEIKRVVNSLLVQLDELPSHCIVVCATNHPQLLDSAVWRRFELKIELRQPGSAEIARMFQRFIRIVPESGLSEADYIAVMAGRNISEIEQFNLDVKRRLVLSRGSLNSAQAVRSVLDRWSRQFAPPSEQNERNGIEADRADPTSAGRRKSHQRKKAALSQQASLPGTI